MLFTLSNRTGEVCTKLEHGFILQIVYKLNIDYFFSFHELEDVSSLQTDILFQNIKGKFHFFSVKDVH